MATEYQTVFNFSKVHLILFNFELVLNEYLDFIF